MSGAGEKLRDGFERTIARLASLPADAVKKDWEGAFDALRQQIARTILSLATAELEEFQLSEVELASLDQDLAIQTVLPIRVYIDLTKGYLAQTIGVRGTKASVERGLGGDLMHSLYAPYVDVWRSDRRFGAVAESVDLGGAVVCSRLNALPSLI